MKILLEELPHQEESLKAIMDSFTGLDEYSDNPDANYVYGNPLIRGRYNEQVNIDVKMETGTGKTYVYTRMMYELQQKFGLFKFILVVPSPAIKEGAKNFIESDYAKRHFSQFYENVKMEVNVINAGDFKAKSGRKNFPGSLINFIEGSRQDNRTIQVLLINAAMLNSKNMKKNDYDQTLLGGMTSPIEALQRTRSIVIMDEPHRFPRDKANYKAIESIEPQMIVRFGATFPDITEGRGKNKVTRKDYYRRTPQFDLNAVESFNNGLVKGIDIYYPNLTEEHARNRFVVDSVAAKRLILRRGGVKYELGVGDNLADIDSLFEGDITYAGGKELSNELELEKGMELVPGTFTSNYQEYIIQDAIDKHFEIEIKNFMRNNEKEYNQPRIKTLSLFFIDSIYSYRDKNGWLKDTFERLLKKKLIALINEYQYKNLPREKEYLEYLRATQESLNLEDTFQNVHAGYFGEDRGSGDEAIQAQVDDILKNKEKLLSFKDKHGNWETRRFLFSKWTLREGWDNPNVFVIAKLRTSGSENSKIQEVGRGLRLPVDENGHRLQQEEWASRLAYLIGYDERDFAQKLVSEINLDAKVQLNHEELTNDMIQVIVTERKKENPSYSEDELLEHLDGLNIITRTNKFKKNISIDEETKDGFDWLLQYYPELNDNQVLEGKIRDNKKKTTKLSIKLSKDNWNKLKSLWKDFSKRYMLEFERIPDSLQMIAEEIMLNAELYERQVPTQTMQSVEAADDKRKVTMKEAEQEYNVKRTYTPGMKYGHFLKKLVLATNLPVKMVHPLLLRTLKEQLRGDSRYLSEHTLKNLKSEFKRRFDNKFAQLYSYQPLDFQASTSIYDATQDQFKEEVAADYLGVMVDENAMNDERYLYELPPMRYDSVNPERDLLRHKYTDKVTVFGKLPKKAIQVPKYTGGTTTPDFIYMIEREDDSNVYLLVETKAENMRVDDERIIEVQRKFFEEHNVEFQMATSAQQVYSKIRKLANEGED